MELTQARILLRKINQIFDAVSDSNSEPSRIEVDLLQDYIRQFYASLLPDQKTYSANDRVITPPTAAPMQEKRTAAPAPQPPVVEEKLPEPTVEEKMAEPALPMTPKADPVPVGDGSESSSPAPSPQPATPDVIQEVTRTEKPNGTPAESEVLFAMEEATDLSGKLRKSPIEDLSRALGINERFLTINELFQGDHEAFDQALRRLNDLPSFSAARTYLEKEIIPRYDWLDTKRLKKAGVFIQLIRRRYL